MDEAASIYSKMKMEKNRYNQPKFSSDNFWDGYIHLVEEAIYDSAAKLHRQCVIIRSLNQSAAAKSASDVRD
jgi:hypothetical protein